MAAFWRVSLASQTLQIVGCLSKKIVEQAGYSLRLKKNPINRSLRLAESLQKNTKIVFEIWRIE
jgi:hypothetical protein